MDIFLASPNVKKKKKANKEDKTMDLCQILRWKG